MSEDNPFVPVVVANPFAPVEERSLTPPEDRTYQEVNDRGHIIVYKQESGVPVKLQDLGHIKDRFNQAIWKAALRHPNKPLTEEELEEITNVDLAAVQLASRAAGGDMDAINALFDRVLGKPKQTSESINVDLNIDAILTGEKTGPPIIEIKAQGPEYGGGVKI